jgi:hypothetical protein
LPSLRISVLGWPVLIDCAEVALFRLVDGLYGRIPIARGPEEEVVWLGRTPAGVYGKSRSGSRVEAADEAVVLSWLDDLLTLGAQRRRQDLLFVHAAALTLTGRALLLAADSGGGKSTTAWAAIHHGFSALSDELAPVDPRSLSVHPHPRAICLRSRPPDSYRLPRGTLRTTGGFHVPTSLWPRAPSSRPAPLGALVFLLFRPGKHQPALRPISVAETAGRLYAQTLNALAHEGGGLATALALANRVPGFVMQSGDLGRTCTLLAGALTPTRLARGRS